MAKYFMLLFLEYLRCLTVKDSIQHAHSTEICICVRVWYICVFMCIHVCVCIWLLVWTYWYAHICVCVGVCVFAIFIWHFNPSSVFLYIIYIAHCAIILLCTLMLYICDRSTPDLNKDDELSNEFESITTRLNIGNFMDQCGQWFGKSGRRTPWRITRRTWAWWINRDPSNENKGYHINVLKIESWILTWKTTVCIRMTTTSVLWKNSPAKQFKPLDGNISSPAWQNGCRFADDIFRCIFVYEKFCILVEISLNFVLKSPIDMNPALVQIMAWCPIGESLLAWFTKAAMPH